ncbi:MAG: GNAT family N-acetyltransferase [Thermosipho sp. (in: Bacteria)]|nr:GNAT family N-acetyltransferase [Thermosipho sp. (in: thermotogales)]
MNLKILTLDEFSRIDFINLVNKVFEDYTVPIKWDVVSFQLDVKENSISLSDSFVFLKDNIPFGFIVVSIRKEKARIDAMGVIKEERGTGAASYILEHTVNYLKWRGIRKIQLEVVKDDIRAYKFYEKHGFREKRLLYSMILKKTINQEINYRYFPVEPRTAYIQALEIYFNGRKPNWQREPISLLLSDNRYNFTKIVTNSGEGYLVWGKLEKENVPIIDIVAKNNYTDILKASINFLKSQTNCKNILISSVPEDDYLYQPLKKVSFQSILTQSEMEKEIF